MKIPLKVSYGLNILLLTVFSIMRIYRNSLGYSATGVGGIWNVITIVFILTAVLATFGLLNRKLVYTKSIRFAIIYSLVAQMNVLLHAPDISISALYNFLMIGYFPAVLIVFYVGSQNGMSQKLKKFSIAMSALITIMSFVSVFWFRTGRLSFSMVSNAYYALCLLPYVLLLTDNKTVKAISYISVGAVVVFSGKRTGLICYVAFIIIVAFYDAFRNNRIRDFLRTVFLIAVALIAFSYLYSWLETKYNLNLLHRMTTLVQDGGSGRDDIYRQIWSAMKQSNLIEWIFGHGYGSADAVILKHATAHDDFLEILYDYGLISTLSFILFYIYLLKDAFVMFRAKYDKAHIFLGGVVISLILSLFSTYCVSFAYVSCGMAFIGTALAQWRISLLTSKK